jgi:hypothetical protein
MNASRRSATRLTALRADCQLGLHAWHPTFVTGEFLCLYCGSKAYCPGCVPPWDAMKRLLHPCSRHQEQYVHKES